jgi:hypothetical protein
VLDWRAGVALVALLVLSRLALRLGRRALR